MRGRLIYCLYMKGLKAFLAGFIPRRVSSKLVLGFLNFFSFRIPKRLREKHYRNNLEQWSTCFTRAESGGFLEYQSLLTTLSFGNHPASYNSCEAIAVYNAEKALGKDVSFPYLLMNFENRGLALFGTFGTAPKKIVRYFTDIGEKTESLIGKAVTEEAVDALEKRFTVFVVTVYNDRTNILAMIHTMCITREETGFLVHNSGGAAEAKCSLFDALSSLGDGRALTICLIGVRERR